MREKLHVIKNGHPYGIIYVLGNWAVKKDSWILHKDHLEAAMSIKEIPKDTIDKIKMLFTDDRIEYFDTSIPEIYRIFIKYNIPIPNVNLLDPAIVVVIARHTLKYVNELFDYEFDPCVRLAHIKIITPRQAKQLIKNGEDDLRVLDRLYKSKRLHPCVRKTVKLYGSNVAKEIFGIK